MIRTVDNNCNTKILIQDRYTKMADLNVDWNRNVSSSWLNEPLTMYEDVGRYHCTDDRIQPYQHIRFDVGTERPVYTTHERQRQAGMRTMIAARREFTRRIWRTSRRQNGDRVCVNKPMATRQRDGHDTHDGQSGKLRTHDWAASSSLTTRTPKYLHTIRAHL